MTDTVIYVDCPDRKVTLGLPVLPVDNQINVAVTRDGVLVYTPSQVAYEDGDYFFTLPYNLSQVEATYEVEWSLAYFENGDEHTLNRKSIVDTVRPILPLPTIKGILGPDAEDHEVADVEKAVRLVIQAHTGQFFGYARKTLTVEGHGEAALRLPERLVELEGLSTLNASLNIHRAIITSDGWYLKKGWTDEVTWTPNADEYFSGTSIDNDGVLPGEPGYEQSDHGHIIVAPGATGKATPFRDDYPFRISGWWGYKSVPPAVQEAAKLLVNDYACQEAIYRDRYLESIKAADWRLQFSSRAWEYTGNARADQLLSEYVLADWAVI